jgi:hypothetical protein
MAADEATQITELRERIDAQFLVVTRLTKSVPGMIEGFVVALSGARNGEQSLARSAGNR